MDNMVTATQIITASVRMESSAGSKYHIVADVNVNNGTAYSGQETGTQITGGSVILNDVTKATFNKNGNSLNINYPDSTEEEQTEILAAVNSFCVDVKEYICGSEIIINNNK